MWEGIQALAKDAGRDPSELKLIVRANVSISREAGPEGRFIFTGSEDQIKEDISAVRELGADELHFDPTTGAQGNSVESWLESMERVRELAGATAGAAAS
jgi:alkanesulfonate monooxygenase SsuD/methylene tetrahydromethanopterin reductase-like flavin-dependent oxidoreductase (luciferase family)